MGLFSFFKSNKPKVDSKCKCDDAKESTCKIISPGELRKIANEAIRERVEKELESIKDLLKASAKRDGVTPVNIHISLENEAAVLNALAECGLSVDLSTRDEFNHHRVISSGHPYSYINTVKYWVSF